MYGPPLPDYRGLPDYVRAHGWPEGLERFVQDSNQSSVVTPDIRMRQTGWKGLLSWRERQSALVCDAGCGTAPMALSPHFDRVYAVYGDPAMTDVVRARLHHCDITNVHVSTAIPDARWDAAVFYGLPCDVTSRLLESVKDRLRPHATAYIAIHAPRPSALAEVFRPDYHTVASSARRIFRRVRPYWYMGSIIGGCELRTVGLRQRNWRYRLGAVVAPWLGAYFGFQASRQAAGPSLIEDILTRTSATLSLNELTVERIIFAHPAGLTLVIAETDAQRRMIIRVPFGERAERLAENNARTLVQLGVSKAAPAETPRFLCSGSVHEQPFFVESAVGGSPAPRLTDDTYGRVLGAATDFLIGLHRATMRPVVFDDAAIAEFIEPIMDAGIERLQGQDGDGVLPEVRDYILSCFRGRTLNIVTTHGDFAYDNLLFDSSGRVAGAFDWDLASPAGLPLIDLAYLFATTLRRYDRRTNHGFTPGILQQFNAVEEPLLRRYCEALQIPRDLVFPLFLMSWLHQVGIRLQIAECYRTNPYFWTDLLNRLPGMIRLHEATPA